MLTALVATILVHSSQASLFGSGEIPKPMELPSTVADDAEFFADKVAAHDKDSGSALVAGLLRSGFSIIDDKGKVLLAPPAGQTNGLGIHNYELQSMINENPGGPKLRFKSMSDSLAVLYGDNYRDAIHGVIVSDWRNGLESHNRQTAFLARFVDDLSQHGDQPWSITGSTKVTGQIIGASHPQSGGQPPNGMSSGFSSTLTPNSASAALSQYATQFLTELAPKLGDPSLSMQDRISIMQQLGPIQQMSSTAGLMSGQSMYGTPGNPPDLRQYGDCPLSVTQYTLLTRKLYGDVWSAHLKSSHKSLLASIDPMVAADDRDYTSTFLDGVAAADGALYSNFITTEENIGKGAAEQLDGANAIGAWTKMIMTFIAFDLTLDPPKPEIERHKDKTPGDPLTLTSTVKIQMPPVSSPTGKGIGMGGRAISWGAGMDLSLPDDGPVAGAEVTWHLDEPTSVLDHAAQFVDPTGAGNGNLKITAVTKNDGQAVIAIQGTPQKEVKPANSVSYIRPARVEVEVKLKGANLYQDMVDAAGMVAGGVSGLKSSLADMLNRSSIFTTRFYPVKIKDWTRPVYEGTFNLTMQGFASRTEPSGLWKWNVDRQIKGKIVSLTQGSTISLAQMTGITGPYTFTIESLHDASVKDSFKHHFIGAGPCGGKAYTVEDDMDIVGPVAQYGFPYTLSGGIFAIKDGPHNQLNLSGQTCFSLPCRFVHTITDDPPVRGIDTIDFVIEFNKNVAAGDSLRDSVTQTRRVTIGDVDGNIICTLEYELHKVADAQ